MTDKKQITRLYEDMLRYMIAKDTVSLGALLSEDSVLVHMTGHRQSKSEYLREIASGVLNYYRAQPGERRSIWRGATYLAPSDGLQAGTY